MTPILRPSPSQQKVVMQDEATLDRVFQRSIIRRTSVAGLIGLVYGICAGVILAAYHEFGSLSLLESSPLVVADPAQVRLLSKEQILDDAVASQELAPQAAPAAALAAAGPLASPIGHIRPAIALWSAAEPVGGVAAPPAAEGRDSTRDLADPKPSGDEPRPEVRPLAAAPEPAHPGTAVAMPKPVLKPLDAITTLVSEATAPAARRAPQASRNPVSQRRPPRPPLKPAIVASEAPPEPARGPEVRATAAPAPTVPEALRSFWTNLKILLASAPARSEFRGDSNRTGGGKRSAINAGRRTGNDSGSGPSDSAGGTSPSDSAGGTSPSGSAGGNSPSGSAGGNSPSGSAGDGSSSDSSGGTSPSGSAGAGGPSGNGGASSSSNSGGIGSASGKGGAASASSGGRGSSVSSGGDSGRGRGDGDRGGRGGRDRGDDRGGRGDGDRGGRGDGRGGDDDD
jgi:hypothetical protein